MNVRFTLISPVKTFVFPTSWEILVHVMMPEVVNCTGVWCTLIFVTWSYRLV